MKLKDARYMSASAQEALRYRVVNAVENGMSKSVAARVFARFAYSNTQLDESHCRARKKSTKGKKEGTLR